jgi:hypothetical protein
MRATREVENSISKIAMLPSFDSKHLENGSVVNIRNPFEVPGGLSVIDHKIWGGARPYRQLDGCGLD